MSTTLHDGPHPGPDDPVLALAAPAERDKAIITARWLTGLTIAWNAIEAVVSIVAGVVAGSVSLIGFGVDAVIEVSSASIVGWRLGQERRDGCRQADDRLATRLIAISLGALATYVAIQAVLDLVTRSAPEASPAGIVIAALSLVVMPLLARGKRRVAPVLGSRAVAADATQTDICTMLSGLLLVGLGANAVLGWWWADPLAGVGIAAIAGVEAVRTWRAESLADTCCA